MMNLQQLFVPTIAVAAMALSSLSACGGKGKNGESGGKLVGSEVLSVLAKDTRAVLGVSVSQGTKSGVFKRFEEKIIQEVAGELKSVQSKCGFDLMDKIDTVVVASSDIMNERSAVIAFETKLTQAQLESCIVKLGGIADKGIYAIDDPINAYWPSEHTLNETSIKSRMIDSTSRPT